jgi:hypothetical protein
MSDQTLADLLPEPPDGTVLVTKSTGVWEVIRRNDRWAAEMSESDDERWFNISDVHSKGMTWRSAVRYADVAYALGDEVARAEASR